MYGLSVHFTVLQLQVTDLAKVWRGANLINQVHGLTDHVVHSSFCTYRQHYVHVNSITCISCLSVLLLFLF